MLNSNNKFLRTWLPWHLLRVRPMLHETASSIVRANEAADAADVTGNDDRLISSYDTVDPVMWAEVDNTCKVYKIRRQQNPTVCITRLLEEQVSMKDQSCNVRDAKDTESFDGHLFSDNRFDTGNDVSAFYLPFVDTLPYDVILSTEFTSDDETIEQTNNEDFNLDREFPSDITCNCELSSSHEQLRRALKGAFQLKKFLVLSLMFGMKTPSTGSASVVEPVSTDVVVEMTDLERPHNLVHNMACSTKIPDVLLSTSIIRPVSDDFELEDERHSVRVEHLLNYLVSNSVHPESWGTVWERIKERICPIPRRRHQSKSHIRMMSSFLKEMWMTRPLNHLRLSCLNRWPLRFNHAMFIEWWWRRWCIHDRNDVIRWGNISCRHHIRESCTTHWWWRFETGKRK